MFQPNAKGFAQRAQRVGHSYKEHRIWIAAVIVAAGAFFILASCNKGAPTSDPTPPTVSLLKWEKNPQGGQGGQTTIQSGGQFTVLRDWLGTGGATNKADIRVDGSDNEGVRLLEVSGSAKGPCSTEVTSNGQFFTSSGPLTASFPKQTETASPGVVKAFMAIHLDDFLAKASCGTHQFANMLHPQEFFLDSGIWTITARAENCCAGQTTGTFTIIVQ
jgi:hypothetical protein